MSNPTFSYRTYTPRSYFIRAALDLAKSHGDFQGFGSDFVDLDPGLHLKALREEAIRRYELGLVKKATFRIRNNCPFNGKHTHLFFITFSSSPYEMVAKVTINIASDDELNEKAKYYKTEASYGVGIRNPQPIGTNLGKTL